MSEKLKHILKKLFHRLVKARPGIGLPMVLVVVLVTSFLVAFIFQSSAQFMVLSTRQQETYMNHLRAKGYMEMVKGMISIYNEGQSSADLPALHCQKISDDQKIDSADDLRIYTVPGVGNVDINETVAGANQRVRVRVYDASYEAEDLSLTFSDGGYLKSARSETPSN